MKNTENAPATSGTFVRYYASGDVPVTGSWSVYVESYAHQDDHEPIDGSQVYVSTHATENEARAEAQRLFGIANLRP